MQVKVALREAKYFGVLCSASLASLVSSVFVRFLCWPPWSPLMCFGYFVLARFGLLASLDVPWCPQCGLGLGGAFWARGFLGLVLGPMMAFLVLGWPNDGFLLHSVRA